MPDAATPTLAEARDLLAALVAHVAQSVDVRLLLIKGPTLSAHGLRAPRESADVDVLVSSDGFERLTAELASAGWHSGVQDTTAHILPQHSLTLVHDAWPLELDVHHYFPGFLADPQELFDLFWDRRDVLDLAHQPVWMTDRGASALLCALHYERAPRLHESAMADLVGRIRAAFDEQALVELGSLAETSGSAQTLSSFLEAVDAPASRSPISGSQELADWRLLRSAGSVPGVAWLEALRRASWRRRPGILWRAVMFTEDELRFLYPNAAPGRRGLWGARLQRMWKAVRRLPDAARALRGSKR